MADNFLTLSGVSKSYGRSEILRNVNLTVRRGEFVAIIGYSGSGKTTLMSLLAGLIRPDQGEIRLDGKAITQPGPDRGVVLQNYSLLPWLTVYGNIALAIEHLFHDWTAEQRRAHIERYIAMVNLTPARDKRPAQLSGGMRQRVSLARALAMNPSVLLLDEPLSALDALTRATLQDEIEKLWRVDQKTVILVTNHVDEGLLLADRIVPLTVGPGATLAREFIIDVPRPRDRLALNHDRHFQHLRNEITDYLTSQRRQSPDKKGNRGELSEATSAPVRMLRCGCPADARVMVPA